MLPSAKKPSDDPCVCIVDGKAYDFTEWRDRHPGGRHWFNRNNGRDISPGVHAYHSTAAYKKIELLLPSMEVLVKDPMEIADPTLNVPEFILPVGFDLRLHMPTFDWSKPMLGEIQEKVEAPAMQRRIRNADRAFDAVSVLIVLFHVFLCFPALYYQLMPPWALVPLFVITRTSLAGVGHYGCHRKKDGINDWNDVCFDLQYVGAHLILSDGHVSLHHFYTETPADVKRTVFVGMLTLPRLLRVPVYTAQKFGQFFSGMIIRWAHICLTDPQYPILKKNLWFFFIRIYMLVEFFFAIWCGYTITWFVQFVVTLWISLIMIVSSHDFEKVRPAEGYSDLDWAAFQTIHSLDMEVTGCTWIDIFLTAGLGCHRVHHVLPYQRSGFANIISMPILREACAKYNIEWEPTRSFVRHRLCPLGFYYLTAPAQLPALPEPKLIGGKGFCGFIKEHLSLSAWVTCLQACVTGFLGVGSI